MQETKYTLSPTAQMIYLNKSVNFRIIFQVKSLDNPFYYSITTQKQLDSGVEPNFKASEGGVRQELISNNNVQNSYVLMLKADTPTNVTVSINEQPLANTNKTNSKGSTPPQYTNQIQNLAKPGFFWRNKYIIIPAIVVFFIALYFFFASSSKSTPRIPYVPSATKFPDSDTLDPYNEPLDKYSSEPPGETELHEEPNDVERNVERNVERDVEPDAEPDTERNDAEEPITNYDPEPDSEPEIQDADPDFSAQQKSVMDKLEAIEI